MPLSPAEIEQWLSDLEQQFENMASQVESELLAQFGELPEVAKFAGDRFREVNDKFLGSITDLLAATIRSNSPIEQSDLDKLRRQIAEGLRIDG